MLLKRGIFRGLLVAGALFGATTAVEPPVVPPTQPTASLYAPGAMSPTRRDGRSDEALRIKRQNDTILAVVMAAVNSRLLE